MPIDKVLPTTAKKNKKSVLSQGNRAMSQLLFQFVNIIHYKFNISQASKGFRVLNIPAQTEFNAKWPFKVTQDHVIWGQCSV